VATFSTEFLGCKVSYTDAQAVRDRLLAGGLREELGSESIAVVNTCCVTHEAVRKSRKAARRAAARAEQVYVTGCGANLEDAFEGLPDNVTVIARPSEQTPAAVAEHAGALGCTIAEHRRERVRAFLKIQDGCSFSCSFCVVPAVRGSSRSRKLADVLVEARRRAGEGYRELVLSGINLGCYRDPVSRTGLAELLGAVSKIDGIARLRLSSIEVNHLTGELIDTMRELPTVAPHLHVPLQSGDDDVLAEMARRYDVATYIERVKGAEDMNITTDVIVGFPGEDERAFERTLETVREVGATKVHVFPYSPRPGTETQARDSVPQAVKRARSLRLRQQTEALARKRWREKLGTHEMVLVDRPGRGYGPDYTPWLLDAPVGAFTRVRAVGVSDAGVLAA
jgi:threonylcarbamoyladenosine tRNA methylthiotransferase MtaB